MSKGEATRARIVQAATAEFARHGIAGARVDRIAEQARANKAQLYALVGSKDVLFDAVFDELVDAVVDAVPLTPEDLPSYAVRLHDAYLADPALVRLLTWARLERTSSGPLFAHVPDHDVDNLAALTSAQRDGTLVDDVDAGDLWAMLIALAGTWAQAAIVHTATADEPPADHQRRRDALARTVRRAFCPVGASREAVVGDGRLAGWQVLEVGIRQAWPFLGLGDADGRELRIYVDASWTWQHERYEATDSVAWLRTADDLVGVTLTEDSVDEDGTLVLVCEEGRLAISGEAEEYTTGPAWWCSPERRS